MVLRDWPAAAYACLLATAACTESVSPSAGPPAALDLVSGDLQSGPVGKELPDPLVARVVDSAGRPVKGQLVNFRVTVGDGAMFAGSSLSNDSGVVQGAGTPASFGELEVTKNLPESWRDHS